MCITIWRESAQRNERGSLCNALTQIRSLSSSPIYKGNSAALAYIESPERDRGTRRRVQSRRPRPPVRHSQAGKGKIDVLCASAGTGGGCLSPECCHRLSRCCFPQPLPTGSRRV